MNKKPVFLLTLSQLKEQRKTPIRLLISAFFLCALASFSFADSAFESIFKSADQYQDVLVKEVRSADTLVLESGEKIKLIGLRAPEVPRRKEKGERDQYGFRIKEEVSPLISIEERSLRFVKELLEGKHVRLEFDNTKKDDQFTTVAYAFSLEDNTLINAEIIRQGYAHLRIQPPNTKYAQELRGAYKEARNEKRGLQGD